MTQNMRRRKMFHKILAGTIALTMCIGFLPSVQAEEAQETEENMEIIAEYETVAEEAAESATELVEAVEEITEAPPEDAELVVESAEVTTSEEASGSSETVTPSRVSVHDPSIFKGDNGTYYIVGSHTASASSTDLIQWSQLNSDYGNVADTPLYGNLLENLAIPFQWAGYDDGDCSGGGYAVWAPDAIWNPHYEWEDGTTGAYMLYCCTSSTWRRSCISYLVSKTVDGTYEYVDTIVYSGFTKTGEVDGSSTRNTKWDNDYLNLTKLIELGSENGGIDEISDNWFNGAGGWDNTYAPNAIDPNLFFDASGEKLYMSYGSWSGGLFLLELDTATGEAIYPGVDSTDEASGNFVDRYFGVHLAGGNHQSGEGPYIFYDEEAGYYYMYETYGGLTAEGGYNMRLFRSENPTGPYLDAEGNNAADSGENNDFYGIKVMGNYSFYNQVGKRAAGHNSVLIDDDGSRYLFYHQRFDIEPQLEAHEVRVHQQFLNEDLWPVTAVYEYIGETPENYEDSEVLGSYEFINHGTATSGEMLDTQMLTLLEDGTVSGAACGTWSRTDSGKGYDYVTLVLDDVTYKGIFFRQHKENSEENAVMTFTAIGSNNETVWGSMIDMEDDEMVTDMAAVALGQQIPSATVENITLPETVMGADVTWTTEDASIISETGEVAAQDEDVRVELTAQITRGDVTVTETYKVTVCQKASLIYGFDFETAASEGAIAPMDGSEKTESALLVGEAAITEDETRGNVLQITNEPESKGVNYLKLPEDTLSDIKPAGYSVAMWVNIGESTWEHSALFEADADGAYPLTRIGANLIARINANSYSDVQGALLTTSGERGVWQHVVYTVNPQGIRVYLNGELVGEEVKNISDCFLKNKTGISQARDVYVGCGYIWDDEDVQDAKFDDVKVYAGVLTAADVAALYAEE